MTNLPASIEQAAGEAGSDALGALLRVSLNDDGSLQQAATQKALGGSIPAIGNGTYIPWSALWPTDSLLPPIQPVVVETIFAAGHGFTKTGSSAAGASVADDTTNYVLGSQSLEVLTDGTGNAAGSGPFCAARKTGMTALDATGKYLLVWIRVDHPERLSSLPIGISSDTFTNWSQAELISPSTNAATPYFVANQWTPVLIPWGAFVTAGGAGATRSALTGFNLRVSDNGSGPVNVWFNMIATVSEPSAGILSFSFDDGYIGQFTKAKPYMDKYGFRATYAPIIDLVGTGTATTGYMSLAQLQALRNAKWEPAVHAYTTAVHNAYASQSDATMEADIQQAKAWMRANDLGPADNFLIPQGQLGANDDWAQIWKRYFQTARSSYGQVRETYPPARRMGMRCVQCDSGVSSATVNAEIDEAVTNKEWVILKTHNVVDSSASGADLLTATFQAIVDHVATSGIKVKTIGEVVRTGLV